MNFGTFYGKRITFFPISTHWTRLISLYKSSDSQPGCYGTLGYHELMPGVPPALLSMGAANQKRLLNTSQDNRRVIPKVCSTDHYWSANPYRNEYFVLREAIKNLSAERNGKVGEPLA